MRKHTLQDGEVFLREGERGESLFLLHLGEAEVFKRDRVTGEERVLRRVRAGEILGELALLDGEARSASVQARGACEVHELRRGSEEWPEQLGGVVAARLRESDEGRVGALREREEEERARSALSLFLVTLLLGNGVYMALLGAISRLSRHSADTIFATLPLLLFYGAGAWWAMGRSGLPLPRFGLTKRGLFRSLREGLLFTLPLLFLTVASKWIWVRMTGREGEIPLFELGRLSPLSPSLLWLTILAYALTVPLQELIVRGYLQGGLSHLLAGRRRGLLALLLSDLMYSLTHLHISPLFAFLAFWPGLLWGWLFLRHGSLWGVVLSHILAGVFAFYGVGFYTLLHS